MFERLTTPSKVIGGMTLKALCESCGEDGCDSLCEEHQDNNCVGCPVQESFERLADYENSKLSPEQVHELAKAQEDGRIVVLPDIPKNKTLYWLWGDEIMPVRYKGIHHGCVDKKGNYHVVCKMTTKKPRTFTHRRKEFTYPIGDERYFYADDLGKTVFLTHEAAKKALGGAKDGAQT